MRGRDECSENRISFAHADVSQLDGYDGFDAVVTNPPYFRRFWDLTKICSLRARDHGCGVTVTCKVWKVILKSGGDLHDRPSRLSDIFEAPASSKALEPKEAANSRRTEQQ